MPTLNRASYIGETLDSILPQLHDDMEVVIVDGGSGDGTAEVVRRRAEVFPCIRYHLTQHLAASSPKPSNAGYDRDCDYAVQLAQGRYCWLLPDDDLLVPDAIARLAKYLETGVALVVANAEIRSKNLSRMLVPQRMEITEDVFIARGEANRLMKVAGRYLSYAGGVVIRRDWWLAKDRERYYGSGFIHITTLFQAPSDLDAVVIARPLIRLRYGNALWSGRAFMIWMFQWPELIWSFPLEDQAKSSVCPREPWRDLPYLAMFRARGIYAWPEFQGLLKRKTMSWKEKLAAASVAAIPGGLLNAIGLLWICVLGKRQSMPFVNLSLSRHNLLGRLLGRDQEV